ncbi:MAG TPA: ABC transporter ATP-binding protein [Thermoanaerobaculia bacterium]|nr:ABC transporter ATP-binding protein [Thermoanaerobaculia bacterium]
MSARPVPAASSLLSVRALTIAVPGPTGEQATVVDGVSFDVAPGEIVALVGESGCGKSLTGLALLDLVPPPVRIASGDVLFEGRDVRGLSPREKERLRGGGVGLVFQEPGSALDPVRTIGSELVGVLRRHRGLARREAREEAVRWLSRVALPDPERQMHALPQAMSGGMRQRAMLALALAGGPRLLVADEPTTALDVTIQAQILSLLLELRRELALAILLVTHDLGVVAEAADRALVMYAGEIVESASVPDLFDRPAHPYTRGLLSSRPAAGEAGGGRRLPALAGTVPEPGLRPRGCAFEPRCPEAFGRCRAARPTLLPAGGASEAACFLADVPAKASR